MQNFAIYRSSAGSGKTFSLVREYLRIALSDTEDPPRKYKEILAITFTNKAAAEMKERILYYLKDLAVLKGDEMPEMGKQLMKLLNIDRLTLCSRAKDVLQAILHNYSEFSVGTIDAFTHRIVRAFSYDLDLPVNFEVETDEKNLIREAVDLLITRVGDDEELTKLMVEYSRSRADEEKGWQPESEIRDIAAQLLKEEGGAQAEKLRNLSISDFLQIRDTLRKYLKQHEQKLIQMADQALMILDNAGITDEMVRNGKNGISGSVRRMRADISNVYGLASKLEKLGDSKLTSGKVAKSDEARASAAIGEFVAACQQLADLAIREKSNYISRKSILRNIYALSLLNEVEKIIRDFRDKDHIIHISAFNRMIADVVFREPAPFIYERLGEKYRNYLIDEFQDTSVMQWQNLLPLIDNSLAGGNYTMLVGDGKQAIYRWRNGDVEQFAALPKIISNLENELVRQRAESLQRDHVIVPLENNFRSRVEIVELNNSIFKHASTLLHHDFKPIYEGLHQHAVKNKTGGYAEIELQGEDADPVQHCVDRVNTLLKEGWEPSDIAVILRKNEQVSLVGNRLIQNGIPVLASESLLLMNSGAVSFVVAFLRYLDDPNDHLSAGYVVNWLASEGKIPMGLRDALSALRDHQHDLFGFLQTQLSFPSREDLLTRTIYDRTELIIGAFNLLEKPDAFLLFFLDEVLHFMNSRNSIKSNFHEWWEDRSKKASVVVPEGTNAVTLITIHKAKGLEFPVVIIPFADWKFYNDMPGMWIENHDPLIPELKTVLITPTKEFEGTPFEKLNKNEKDRMLLDMLNELYVAMTRPSIRLYMTMNAKNISKKGEIKGVADILAVSLLKLGYDISENKFTTGSEQPPVRSVREKVQNLEVGNVSGNDWESRIHIRQGAKELWEEGSARISGKLLHLLLSRIASTSQIEAIVEQAITEGVISSEERIEIINSLRVVLESPHLKKIFDSKTKLLRERELLTKEGKILRPDLIAETPTEMIVLDYKTGKQMNEHRTQVEDYARVLEEMGYMNVQRKLFYTSTGECVDW